ncbi:TPA: relaxase/mobilization nuclease domain-containing protein [Streptococcus pyogenes]|uniref:relaxase/mobilization nuclease domain-containing protein n=1 Tax=Priestia TaxID=2800373 RepID=UPI001E53D596|nr:MULTISPECIES: relaxase/mobilization nuclease domain-containing protein [Priestia]MCE4093316.1 relaxase/mobilization nuclease domain-containing protein [Priestia megaterium]MED3820305.1 relaxase/mobilization nuclease domain-containing protein [Priestia aryabhattai]HES8074041.1 relaxase/mobilization nuclease domain-containing protein [Streptococcus pyogenes]
MATIKLSTTKNANALLKYVEKRSEVSNSLDCDVDYVRNQFKATREIWAKNGGIQAHHVIQSFKPDEVDPQKANEIGLQLAEKLAKGHEVAIYTHTDKDHIHNHIVINAVNYEDGRKFHAHGQEAIDYVRKISDELCKEHGLSIVEERSADVRYTLAERSLLQKGKSSWKDEIRTAIDFSKEQAISFEDFQERLKDQGVQATLGGKNITYEHLESNKKVRGTKLGWAYEKETILHGFERQVTRERETTSPATTVNRGLKEDIRRNDFTSQSDGGLSIDVSERKYEQRDDDATGARTDQTDESRRTNGNEIDFANIDQQIRDRHLRAQAIYERNFGRDEDGHQGIAQRDEKESGVSEQRVPNKQSSDQRRTREDQQQPGEQVRHVEPDSESRTQRDRKKQQDYDLEL